jgi:hypothetical protein
MNELVNEVVKFAATERSVSTDTILSVPRLVEIIGYVCEDKNAHKSVADKMASLALRIYLNEEEQIKLAKQSELEEIKKYWDTKLEEFNK